SIDADDLLQVAHRHRGELLEQLGRAWVALHADVGVAWPRLLLLHALGLGVPLVEGFLVRAVFAETLPELRAVRLDELGLTRRRGLAVDQHLAASLLGERAATGRLVGRELGLIVAVLREHGTGVAGGWSTRSRRLPGLFVEGVAHRVFERADGRGRRGLRAGVLLRCEVLTNKGFKVCHGRLNRLACL